MRHQLEEALLLHRKPYRDTSLLLEAFTRHHGRLGIVARGVRGGKRGRAALLQPFQPLLLSWSGGGELMTLNAVEANGAALALSGSGLAGGFYVNELVVRLVARHDPCPDLFATYAATLQRLPATTRPEWPLRLFERDLLYALGYGLMLGNEAGGEAIQPGRMYCYYLEHGPVASAEDVPPGSLPVSGHALLALANGELPERDIQHQCKRLLRHVLAFYLGEKPLYSRTLFRQRTGK